MHATALKKNLDGIGSSLIKICDNEHAVASLCEAVKLCVEDTPRDTSEGSRDHASTWPPPAPPWRWYGIICSDKSCQETSERVLDVIEDSGDVLPDNVAKRSGCSEGMYNPEKFEREVAAGVREAAPEAGYRKALARRARDNDLWQRNAEATEVADANAGEIAPQGMAVREPAAAHVVHAEPIFQHPPRKSLDLAGEAPVDLRARQFWSADARAECGAYESFHFAIPAER